MGTGVGTGALVWVGAGLLGSALWVVLYTLLAGSSAPSGVARSLQLVERRVSPVEVGRADLPATDRLLRPLLTAGRGLAARVTPALSLIHI